MKKLATVKNARKIRDKAVNHDYRKLTIIPPVQQLIDESGKETIGVDLQPFFQKPESSTDISGDVTDITVLVLRQETWRTGYSGLGFQLTEKLEDLRTVQGRIGAEPEFWARNGNWEALMDMSLMDDHMPTMDLAKASSEVMTNAIYEAMLFSDWKAKVGTEPGHHFTERAAAHLMFKVARMCPRVKFAALRVLWRK